MTYNKRFFSFGLLVSCVAALGYGGYVYWNSDTIRMKISGECISAKIPEKDRSSIKGYLAYRGRPVSPAFAVALGDYSSGKDYHENDSLYDSDGPFQMRMKLNFSGNRSALGWAANGIAELRANCVDRSLDFGLFGISPEKSGCKKVSFSDYYIPKNSEFDIYPTSILCRKDDNVAFACTLKIRISDKWHLKGSFKRDYLSHWQDIRQRLIDYSKENFRSCSFISGGSPL